MKKATNLIILSIFCVLMSMAAVCANENATFDDALSLDDTANDTIAADPETQTFDDLSELINGTDDVIELKDDYKYSSTDSVAKGGIVIDRPITINGNGHTIDASNSVRIFIVNSSNVILNNINFINGKASSAGAIGANEFENFTINNCNFSNCSAGSGGAVLSNADYTKITNCNFNDNHADTSGGAVLVRGKGSVIDNSRFTSNDAWTTNRGHGGAVYFSGADGLINNTVFDSNKGRASGGALYVGGARLKINNASFVNNSGTYGGSIFSGASYTTVVHSTFEENEAEAYGGAIYFYWNYYSTVKNSKFTSNRVTGPTGGAIYSDGYYDLYENVTFENNQAEYAGGALALMGVPNAKVNDCYFDSNKCNHLGGGVYTTSGRGCEINNSTFVNCYAASGAGVYMVYSDTNPNSYSNGHIRDSRFYNNTARYGGAGVTATSHATIENSEFKDNTAGNYGGAVSLTHASMINSTLENNSAIFGGAAYIHDSDIINSTFADNSAQIGNAIYILNSSSLRGNDVSDDDVFLYDDDFPGNVVGNQHNIRGLMETDQGYFAYCSEKYNLSPYNGVYDGSMEKLKNSINHQSIGDYLKILIYYYVDNFEDLHDYDFSNYVWEFTDREYWNSEDPVVREVIRLYDSGLRVSTENGCKVLPNGTLMYFNFSSLVTPSGEQNLFLFKFSYEDVLNETLTKEALINKTVYLGDTVEYRIVINNKGSSPVYGNWVEDKDYSEGLVYKTWRSEVGNWTYNEETGRWTLDVLEPGQSASIILTFGVTLEGLLYNNATSGLGVVNVSTSGDGFTAYVKNMTVEKKTLTPQVNVGDLAEFEIVVTNTGDVDLDNVFVCESEYDSGLDYVDFVSEVGTWKHSINEDGKHVFTLSEVLEVDDSASFRVIFTTIKVGNFSNTVTSGYNNTTLSNSTNTTDVIGNETPTASGNENNETEEDIVEDTPEGTDEETSVESPEEIDDETHDETTDGKKESEIHESTVVEDNQNAVSKHIVDEKATGNPIAALLLALILIPIRRFKK